MYLPCMGETSNAKRSMVRPPPLSTLTRAFSRVSLLPSSAALVSMLKRTGLPFLAGGGVVVRRGNRFVSDDSDLKRSALIYSAEQTDTLAVADELLINVTCHTGAELHEHAREAAVPGED